MFFCTNKDENFIFEKIHKEKKIIKAFIQKQAHISKSAIKNSNSNAYTHVRESHGEQKLPAIFFFDISVIQHLFLSLPHYIRKTCLQKK